MNVGPKRALSNTFAGPSAVMMVSPQRQRTFCWAWTWRSTPAGMSSYSSVAAAFRTGLLIAADLVHDLAGDELALLLGVRAPLLLRRDPPGLRTCWIADRVGDRRHLLGARAELMALQLLERRLDLREPGLERLGSLPPLASVIVAAHRRT
jgi:hypothetical protein